MNTSDDGVSCNVAAGVTVNVTGMVAAVAPCDVTATEPEYVPVPSPAGFATIVIDAGNVVAVVVTDSHS